MANIKLDRIDKHILQLMQENGRISNLELADKIGLSPTPCSRRVKRLEDLGLISAHVTLLNKEALGLNLTVFTAVRTHEHTRAWFDQFHKVTMSMPNVMEVHRMSGDVDYLMRAVVPDMKSYDNMYKDLIGKINLFDVSSSFSMETIKYTTALPLHHL